MEAAEKNEQELERLLQGVTEWEAQGRQRFMGDPHLAQGKKSDEDQRRSINAGKTESFENRAEN